MSIKWKTYDKQEDIFTISPKYADDITWVTTERKTVDNIKEEVPPKLKTYNLEVNTDKTEEYEIPQKPAQPYREHSYSKPPNKDKWKKCKLLGSFIDTETDVNNRKARLITNMKNSKHIYKSKHISLDLKIRHFNTYQASIFLYNCSLWTLTPTMEKSIDAFHRRQLRYAIGITYPRKISNEDLYNLTKAQPWSETIKNRRLRLLGHILRLPPNTPAQQALQEAQKKHKKRPGKQKTTWLGNINKDLNRIGLQPNTTFSNIALAANDRDGWRRLIGKN